MAVSSHEDARNQTQILWKSGSTLDHVTSSPASTLYSQHNTATGVRAGLKEDWTVTSHSWNLTRLQIRKAEVASWYHMSHYLSPSRPWSSLYQVPLPHPAWVLLIHSPIDGWIRKQSPAAPSEPPLEFVGTSILSP